MLAGMYFVFNPYFYGIKDPNALFTNLNSALIFVGLAISFSSLQDTSKTQNNFSKKIWENPTKGKIVITIMCCMIIWILLYGLIGYFISDRGIIKELAVGSIILGLGMFGFLKAAIEMFENHRKDKNHDTDKNSNLDLNSTTSMKKANPKSVHQIENKFKN